MQAINPGQIFEHYKGGRYKIVSVGKDKKTKEDVVVYQSLQEKDEFPVGSVWVRPLLDFNATIKLNGLSRSRFSLLKKNTPDWRDFATFALPPFLVFMLNVITFNISPGWYLAVGLDSPMHFLGGFSIAMSGAALLTIFKKLGYDQNTVFKILFLLGFTALCATIWEFYEFLSDKYLGTISQTSIYDTMKDLFLGLMGASLYILIAIRKKH